MVYRQLLLFILLFQCISVFSQKKLVIMGSSTAVGNNASPGNSWAQKTAAYYNQNPADGLDTVVENIARGSQTSYHQLPTGSPPVPGRPSPDVLHNTTLALSLHPDVVIVNLPTNDVANGYSKKEFMDNMRTIFNTINGAGVVCYITTSQPRINVDSYSYRDSLRTLFDSINATFGIYAIDFWSDLVSNDGTNSFAGEVYSDGIHVNDIGHAFLFNRVRNKNIFSGVVLPIKLKNFAARLRGDAVEINWQTELEEQHTVFELERGTDGARFTTIHRQKNAGNTGLNTYKWTDVHPLPGTNFYRLKIIEPGQSPIYSSTEQVKSLSGEITITRMAVTGGLLTIEVNKPASIPVTIGVYNLSGGLLYKQPLPETKMISTVSIPGHHLGIGLLLVKLESSDGQVIVKRFFR